jgi:hypothetical protein
MACLDAHLYEIEYMFRHEKQGALFTSSLTVTVVTLLIPSLNDFILYGFGQNRGNHGFV